jgi:F plasmid transfer operon, TraF, protein
MGGAFVAVADDATATWWNPASLPATLVFDGVVDWGGSNVLAGEPIEAAANGGRQRAFSVSAALPVAGLSFARVHQWRLDPPTAGPAAGRQDEGHVPAARSLLTHHVGVSFAQSIGDAVVIGVTTRLVHGGVSASAGLSGSIDDAFDRAADAPRHSATRGDVDAGVLVRLARLRIGLAGRNLGAPSFDDGGGVSWRLGRRARVGVAVVSDGDRAGRHDWVIAADADLTTDDQVAGTWRGIAAGVERWLAGRRVAVRAGVEASTSGEARGSATGGVSVAMPGGFWLEAAGVAGAEMRRGWGLSAHVMF